MPPKHARNVALTPELNAFVEELVASGDYANASEVLRAGLRSLRDHRDLNEVTKRISDALDQLDDDQGISGDPRAILTRVLDVARSRSASGTG